MAVFAVHYAYADRPEALTEVRPQHRQFLAALLADGVLLASGPYVGGPAGALLLLRATSAESVLALLEADPFFAAGLIVERGAREWLPVMGPFTADAAADPASDPAPDPASDPAPDPASDPAPDAGPGRAADPVPGPRP
jgi:uncharacterized protein YciI